jgi:hypothetical protein
LFEHRVSLWLSDEDNTCIHTHAHTINSKLILRWFFDFYSFAFLLICASSNLSTKIYERSLIPSEKNLGVFRSWNRSQQMKNFRSRSRVSESKNLTPQLLTAEVQRWIVWSKKRSFEVSINEKYRVFHHYFTLFSLILCRYVSENTCVYYTIINTY